MDKDNILLVIDPAMRAPAAEALNCIAKIFCFFSKKTAFPFSRLEFCFPCLNKDKLSEFIQGKNIGACISLGSHANITDQHEFVDCLAQDLNRFVFSKQIPFLGICFSHQLLAHVYGCQVNYLKNKDIVPNGKHHGFRLIEIDNPRLALLSANFSDTDYFSDNEFDQKWKKSAKILEQNAQSVQCNETLSFLKNHTTKQITVHARHEQEVFEVASSQCPLNVAAKSKDCAVEALIHHNHPIFSFQTHLETHHPDQDGFRILKNFIYLSCLYQ